MVIKTNHPRPNTTRRLLTLDINKTFVKVFSTGITTTQLKSIQGLLGDNVSGIVRRDRIILTIGRQDDDPLETIKSL